MYQRQNFTHLSPVTAAALNAMETQITRDEGRLDTQQATLGALDGDLDTLLGGLRLAQEGNYLTLRWGTEMLDAVPIPGMADYVPPTSLALSPASLTIVEGATGALTAAVSPADTSLRKRFFSSDPAVATIDRTGTVTGVSLGRCTVTAKCGALLQTAAVQVDRLLHPKELTFGHSGGVSTEDRTVIHLFAQYKYRAWLVPESGFIVPPGCTATLSFDAAAEGRFHFDKIFAVRALDGGEVVTTVGAVGGKDIKDVEVLYEEKPEWEDSTDPFVYGNETAYNVYLVGRFMGPEESWTDGLLAELQSCLSCRIISPYVIHEDLDPIPAVS